MPPVSTAPAPPAGSPEVPAGAAAVAPARAPFGVTVAEAYQAAGVALLTAYGVEVCPLLASLSWVELGGTIAAAFLALTPLRRAAFARAEARTARQLEAGVVGAPWRYFALELATWTGAGLLLTAFNANFYGFGVAASGLKLTAGAVVLGLFAAMDQALARQGRTIAWFAANPGRSTREGGRRGSIATRIMVFFTAVLAMTGAVLVLLFKKDLIALMRLSKRGVPFSAAFHREVTLEVVFVGVVVVAAGTLLARRYGRNVEAMFDLELGVLEAVREGRYDARVPLVSQDEFRTVAAGTNRMAAGLEERERIRRTFGRYLSPQVAESILADEAGAELGGRQVDVAVLFSDLRDFTPLSERLAPRELVAFLNEYFTELVEVIVAHGGVVDKFIGDAVMVVFGLDGAPAACDRAAACAAAMLAKVEVINGRLHDRGHRGVSAGIGIHYGPVIAGNIGSEQRLEYTVIGDTVNIAARLESATKALGTAVALSEQVYQRLGAGARAGLRDLGPQALKGKSGAVRVFGMDG